MWTCGDPLIDLELLKRHTVFTNDLNANSSRVKYLWEALENMVNFDRVRFIKFCWA